MTSTHGFDALTAALRSREVTLKTAGEYEAAELIGCLRRLVAGASISYADLQRAFGAPGNWGYETPIGDALAQVYRQAANRCADACDGCADCSRHDGPCSEVHGAVR